MQKKHVKQPLHIVATDTANVREVEPNGAILTDIRFVGKVFNSETNEFEVLPDGVEVPYSSHIVHKMKEGEMCIRDSSYN